MKGVQDAGSIPAASTKSILLRVQVQSVA